MIFQYSDRKEGTKWTLGLGGTCPQHTFHPGVQHKNLETGSYVVHQLALHTQRALLSRWLLYRVLPPVYLEPGTLALSEVRKYYPTSYVHRHQCLHPNRTGHRQADKRFVTVLRGHKSDGRQVALPHPHLVSSALDECTWMGKLLEDAPRPLGLVDGTQCSASLDYIGVK